MFVRCSRVAVPHDHRSVDVQRTANSTVGRSSNMCELQRGCKWSAIGCTPLQPNSEPRRALQRMFVLKGEPTTQTDGVRRLNHPQKCLTMFRWHPVRALRRMHDRQQSAVSAAELMQVPGVPVHNAGCTARAQFMAEHPRLMMCCS